MPKSAQMTLTRKPKQRKPKHNGAATADSMDKRLLSLLEEDAGRSSTALARQLGVSAATVRRRLKRLTRSGMLRIVGVADPARFGFPLSVMMTLDVDRDKSESVMKALAKRPEIRWVSATTGPFDLVAIARFPSVDFLSDFMSREIARLEGIKGTQTFICLDGKNGHRTFCV